MTTTDFSIAEHDWQSEPYVDEWINRDIQRDGERRPRLKHMLSFAQLTKDASIEVLDVGGGYGVVSEEVLHAFPMARVTLQDYSQPMLDRARARLARYQDRMRYVVADLCNPSWVDGVAGPFDLIVSAIAIHNLANLDRIAACYGGIVRLLKPGCLFLNYDLYNIVGGIPRHLAMLQEVGFARTDCVWEEGAVAIVAAHSKV
jgi:2-polyprenyl-3-methyl-5-hydroxy-6-metoxy-1,4-benzoquinol methylase